MTRTEAMLLRAPHTALERSPIDVRDPRPDEILIRVHACGVCRTDLHVLDGELPNPKLPLVLGHEIVGEVVATGNRVHEYEVGDRVGVPWLASTCGACSYCASGRENLCDRARFTGYQVDGGYARMTIADRRFCLPVPDAYGDAEAAPLLCAGLIGYRSLRLAGDARRIGIFGFGAAAHIITQVAVHQGREIYAFTRPGDDTARRFAVKLGAVWAGDSTATPPEQLDAAILFAPVGGLVPVALEMLVKGGTVVCGGIHMSDIPSFPYHLLWGERRIVSVANLTRQDGIEFMVLAPKVPVLAEVEVHPLVEANIALTRLREGRVSGAAVLDCR
jgi:propanol-preferring alcohol dehydrogenase